MSEVIKINRDESAESKFRDTLLQESIDAINLQASRRNIENSSKLYNMTCDAQGLGLSCTVGGTEYSLNFTWESISKFKEAIK